MRRRVGIRVLFDGSPASRRLLDTRLGYLAALERLEELLVIADVVRRVVVVRCQYEQNRVPRVAPLGSPDQRRNVQADFGLFNWTSSLAEPSSTRQLTVPLTQISSCEQMRWACAPRTDSLGTSYTVKIRRGANGRSRTRRP